MALSSALRICLAAACGVLALGRPALGQGVVSVAATVETAPTPGVGDGADGDGVGE